MVNVPFRKMKKGFSTKMSNAAILKEDAPFGVIEAYKIARTNIMFSLAHETGGRKIVLTSALPSEGKTTACLNLAYTFSQMDAKVLVIDADLRRPRIHQYLMEKKREGLADYLAGFVELSEIVHHNDPMRFDYILSGQLPPNPAELLASPKMSSLLDELGHIYDYIFIDSPPTTLVTDALVVAKFASGVLIVVKQLQTPRDLLKKTVSSLEFTEAKILGFLMNNAPSKKRSYQHQYKYHDSYSYEPLESGNGSGSGSGNGKRTRRTRRRRRAV